MPKKRSHFTNRKAKKSSLKRAVKLWPRRDPVIFQVFRRAPEALLKQICNAAHNAERGDVQFTSGQKKILRRYRKFLTRQKSKNIKLSAMRRFVHQRGGIAAVILPLILWRAFFNWLISIFEMSTFRTITLVEKALLDLLRQKQVQVGTQHPILSPLAKIQQEI